MKKGRGWLPSMRHNRNPLVRGAFVVVGIGLVFLGGSILWVAFTPIPALNTFDPQKVAMSTKIYDREGKTVLYDLNRDMRRTIIPLDQVSSNLQKATLSIEDSGFYSHGGISPTGIARALLADITTMSFAQGGSTITQQVGLIPSSRAERVLCVKFRSGYLP